MGGRHFKVTKIERNGENRPVRLRVDDVSGGDESTVRPLFYHRAETACCSGKAVRPATRLTAFLAS